MGNLFSSPDAEHPEEFDAADKAELETNENTSTLSNSSSSDDDNSTTPAPRDSVPRSGGIIRLAPLRNPFQAALQAVTNKVQVLASRAYDAISNSVSKIRKSFVGVAEKVGGWAKAHPAQAAAVTAFLVIMVSTPVALASLGFNTAGIAAASAAAGIQSGIGSVAAGSAFAICQSAMMGGYGAFIFAALPAVSSALAWAGAALWTWWKGSGSTDGAGGPTDGDGVGTGIDIDKKVALIKAEAPTMSIAKELVIDTGQIIKLSAIFVAATAVYRYRQWQSARSDPST